MERTNEQIALKVARNSILINAALAAFKLFAGITAQSAAMISDAVHSAADLFGTVIAIIGVKLSGKQPDKEHPYGHERFECVATIILALLLGATGAGIGWSAFLRILAAEHGAPVIPGLLALAAALVSIAVKEGVYWYVRAAAIRINSGVLMADAWHSRVDGLSSIGSFIGIAGARMGFPAMDAVAAIVISLFILKTALTIFKEAVEKMIDKACDDATVAEMRDAIAAEEAVEGIDQLRTRLFGNRIYVDVDICVDGTKTLLEAHTIAECVQRMIERRFPKVKHCMVHVNPALNHTDGKK